MTIPQGMVVARMVLALLLGVAQRATPTPWPIFSGLLARPDLQDGQIEAVRGQPRGTSTSAQHFTLTLIWLAPQEYSTPIQQDFSWMYVP